MLGITRMAWVKFEGSRTLVMIRSRIVGVPPSHPILAYAVVSRWTYPTIPAKLWLLVAEWFRLCGGKCVVTTVCPSEMMGCCRSHDSSSYPYYSTLFLAFSFYEMCRYIVYIMYIDTILRVYIYNMCMYLRVYNDNCVYIYTYTYTYT